MGVGRPGTAGRDRASARHDVPAPPEPQQDRAARLVELPKVGAKVSAMKTFGVVESVKAVSDLYAPLTGEVVEINAELPKKPELVNADPYGKGWMIVIKLSNPKEWETLMSAADYEKLIATAGH